MSESEEDDMVLSDEVSSDIAISLGAEEYAAIGTERSSTINDRILGI